MQNIIFYHLIALLLGFVLDLIFGDPEFMPHPVRLIGKLILSLENSFIGKKGNEKKLKSSTKKVYGILTEIIVCFSSVICVVIILFTSYKINLIFGCVIESILTYYLLATKCLKDESMKVYKDLKNNSLEKARKSLSFIVGRDTKNLSEQEICKATVETIAENTCDGVIAPLFYTALGGPTLGFFYKSVNTLDSMIAYKNERYLDFGRCAAKTDDFFNFIPSRLSAILMIFSCKFLGKDFDAKNAKRIFLRDRFNHESPNSAQTESTCAGALKIKLGGPAYYEGKLENKKFLGDDLRQIEIQDIKRANKLLYASAINAEVLASVIILLILILCKFL